MEHLALKRRSLPFLHAELQALVHHIPHPTWRYEVLALTEYTLHN
jgi:hypothetical protein